MGVSKNSGTPKMDGENNGKPYFLMDDLGGKPTIFGNIHIASNRNDKALEPRLRRLRVLRCLIGVETMGVAVASVVFFQGSLE